MFHTKEKRERKKKKEKKSWQIKILNDYVIENVQNHFGWGRGELDHVTDGGKKGGKTTDDAVIFIAAGFITFYQPTNSVYQINALCILFGL